MSPQPSPTTTFAVDDDDTLYDIMQESKIFRALLLGHQDDQEAKIEYDGNRQSHSALFEIFHFREWPPAVISALFPNLRRLYWPTTNQAPTTRILQRLRLLTRCRVSPFGELLHTRKSTPKLSQWKPVWRPRAILASTMWRRRYQSRTTKKWFEKGRRPQTAGRPETTFDQKLRVGWGHQRTRKISFGFNQAISAQRRLLLVTLTIGKISSDRTRKIFSTTRVIVVAR